MVGIELFNSYQEFDWISGGHCSGSKDVESMKTFVLQETEKAAENALLEDDRDLWSIFPLLL